MTRSAGPIARLRDAYRALARIDHAIPQIDQRVEAIELGVDSLAQRVESLERALAETAGAGLDELRAVVRVLAADEPANRRCLNAAREDPDYELAWTEDEPLVTVTIPTIGRPELVERALPSILAQTHGALEVIVAGDGAGAETEERVRALGDTRVRYIDLGPRLPWTDSEHRLWLVGATRGRNAATRLARGRWLVPFDDDDAMRPDCLAKLLELARSERAEIAYARMLVHLRDGATVKVGEFPPRLGEFSWAAGMHHAGLTCFERELVAAELGVPGDWWLAERMLRAGARFAMSDDVLCDVFPSERHPWLTQGGPGEASATSR